MSHAKNLFLKFVFISKKMRNNRHILEKERIFKMNKLICLMVAALMVVFTACTNNNADDNKADTPNGMVQDGDGIIDENGDDNIVDDAADGANDIVDGATDVVDDAANGVENAVDDMTDGNKNNNNNK